jgi:hypothetical protein
LHCENVFDTHLLEEFLVEVAFDDETSELSLLKGLFENVLFNRVDTDKPIDMHSPRLADSVASILGLLVHGRVPVGIVEDDAVSTCQVDANTAASGGRDEAKDLGVVVKPIDQLLPVLSFDGAIKSHVDVAVQVEELFENVEHLGHLSEYDNLRPLVVEILEELGHLLELATVVLNQVLVGEEQDVRMLECLVYILMLHELLM